jgi:chloramphenicol 3-O phosphotransferase
MAYLLEDLAAFPMLMIGVYCEAAELAKRELARGDRKVGLAMSQLDLVHAGKEYDFRVDTTRESPEQCAQQIASWLGDKPRPIDRSLFF